jgi:hypothetical protein
VLLIIDEFHRVATGSVAILLRESRKANFALAIASQTLVSLSEETQAAALSCGNIMAFRVSGLDADLLAKSFEATPQPTAQHVVPEHPLVIATDAIALLVRDGHRDSRVTRFAQGALANFERFMHVPEPFAWCRRILDQVVLIHSTQLVTARQQLNEAFFQCMREQNPEVYIPPLALYILIASQRAGWEQSVDQWVRKWGEYLSGFAYRAEKFEELLLGRLAETRAQVRWYRPLRQELAWAQSVWHLLTELRYTLGVLARSPLFATTGELELTMYPRTYADQTNQILSDLVSMPNYACRARFVSSGEHVLRTRPLGPGVSGTELTRRLGQIRRQMFEQGLTRSARDVEKEIAERHLKLRGSAEPDEPPPTSF